MKNIKIVLIFLLTFSCLNSCGMANENTKDKATDTTNDTTTESKELFVAGSQISADSTDKEKLVAIIEALRNYEFRYSDLNSDEPRMISIEYSNSGYGTNYIGEPVSPQKIEMFTELLTDSETGESPYSKPITIGDPDDEALFSYINSDEARGYFSLELIALNDEDIANIYVSHNNISYTYYKCKQKKDNYKCKEEISFTAEICDIDFMAKFFDIFADRYMTEEKEMPSITYILPSKYEGNYSIEIETIDDFGISSIGSWERPAEDLTFSIPKDENFTWFIMNPRNSDAKSADITVELTNIDNNKKSIIGEYYIDYETDMVTVKTEDIEKALKAVQ